MRGTGKASSKNETSICWMLTKPGSSSFSLDYLLAKILAIRYLISCRRSSGEEQRVIVLCVKQTLAHVFYLRMVRGLMKSRELSGGAKVNGRRQEGYGF